MQTLAQVCGRIGYPKTIRVDNGSEFITRDMDLWAYNNERPNMGNGGMTPAQKLRMAA